MSAITLGKPLPQGADLPYEDDQSLESDWHRLALNLLVHILYQHWQNRKDIYVGGNMFIYFDEQQVTARNFRGSDVFVVKNVESIHFRKSWVLWEEQWRTMSMVGFGANSLGSH